MRPLALVAALVAVLLAGGAVLAQPASSTAGPHVVEQRAVALDDGRIRGLSPDGQRFVVEADDEVCIVLAPTLAEEVCTAWDGERIDFLSFAWSPDGRRIAFTEDAYRFFVDGDVWVLEADTGLLKNLTDDGDVGDLDFGEGNTLAIDTLPAWSPDGSALVFARGTEATTGLYRVPVEGGRVTLLRLVSDEAAGAVLVTGLDWSAAGGSGGTIAYSLLVLGDEPSTSPTNGVWRMGADGAGARRLLALSPEREDVPVLVEASARGDVLIVYPRSQAVLDPPFFAVLPPDGGPPIELSVAADDAAPAATETAVADDVTEGDAGGVVLGATFSPDGGHLLLGSISLDNLEGSERLAVRDLTTGEETVLLDGSAGVGLGAGQGLDWADDGTIYVAESPFGGTILRVEGVPAAPPLPATPSSPNASASATPGPPVEPGAIAIGATLTINDANVALRAAPSTSAMIVLELAQGSPIEVIGPVEEAGGFDWVPVRDPSTRTVGYVRREFLST